MRPQTAKELWQLLTTIFPGFATDCPEGELEGLDPDTSLHSLMRDFRSYFGGRLATFSERQIKALADFLNEAVAIDGNLENAVATCFLESLNPARSYQALAPFLSRQAKDKTHA